MPDLRPTLEAGPSAQIRLWWSQDERLRLSLKIPARASFTIEASPRKVGWSLAPALNLDVAGIGTSAEWRLGAMAGPLFADRDYHQYFYGVESGTANVGRPAYVSRAGYSGAQLLLSFSRRYPTYWLGGYARHDWLDGAVFSDSPLIRKNSSWTAGVAFARIIGRSSRKVETADRD
jgi:outer membrane scaffolding protein for murein synthesis (MipA/OmpV family)